MNKKILASMAAFAIAVVFISCSKNDVINDPVTSMRAAENLSVLESETVANGIISGTILPFAETTTVVAYNGEYRSEPVFLSKDGTFSIELQPGYYDLDITYLSSTGQEQVFTVQKFEVLEKHTTEAGVIELP